MTTTETQTGWEIVTTRQMRVNERLDRAGVSTPKENSK